MAPFAPFETAPDVAVAVSGGADSLALTLLMADWARACGGRVRAFTVDHGLRPEAAAEARWVGEVLRARGIDHDILTCTLDKAAGEGRQDRARAARYAALEAACADAGLLHLALAHHRGDQAETVLLRVRGHSGPAGLAAMPAERTTAALRVIRPLLAVPGTRLEATLRARGLSWIEDPSNRDSAYLRSRLRAAAPILAAAGWDEARLAEVAALMGRARRQVDSAQAGLLARALTVHPAGFAWLRPAELATAPAEVGRAALAAVLTTVGGRARSPRSASTTELHAAVSAGLTQGRTLGGCRLLPRGKHLLIVREDGRMPAVALVPGARLVYDCRYSLRVAPDAPAGLELRPLGRAGWAAVAAAAPHLRAISIPPSARPALPTVFDASGPREVPALRWRRGDAAACALAECTLAPQRAATGAGFTVARADRHIIS